MITYTNRLLLKQNYVISVLSLLLLIDKNFKKLGKITSFGIVGNLLFLHKKK